MNHAWTNVDMFQNPGVDVVANLEEPLPFKDESFDFILLVHVLEHVKNKFELLRECYRVLQPRGTLHIRVPHAYSRCAISDPTHINLFVEESFFHFCQNINDMGFDTQKGMRLYNLAWMETIAHPLRDLDEFRPGEFFTEICVDYEKPGELYEWEKSLDTWEKKDAEKTSAY